MKGYTVFNAEQCDGLPAHYYAKVEPPAVTPAQRLEAADRFFAATGVDIRQGGTRAYYAEGPDYVQMPPFETFRDAESYAAVLGMKQPTGRNIASGWPATSVASAMATKAMRGRSWSPSLAPRPCAPTRFNAGNPRGSAAYIATWITVLKNEKRAIFSAAAHAQRAADYLPACNRGRPGRNGPPHRRPVSHHAPASLHRDRRPPLSVARPGGAAPRPGRRRPRNSRRCSPCGRITGRRVSATPQSAIASRACSPLWSEAVESRAAEAPVGAGGGYLSALTRRRGPE